MDPVDRTPYTPLQGLAFRPGGTETPETDAARLRRFGSNGLALLITTPNNDPDCNPSARTLLLPISPIVQGPCY
jgi:hypothetical protein